jgi:hypothetical protein
MPTGVSLPQNVFFLKNEQTGQYMIYQGQPQLPSATTPGIQTIQGPLRLPPSSQATTLRVIFVTFTCLLL